ncbi:hypothetical protein I4F81_000095 [Pyropia yezoensis]|uniref:Uncharacterized protein n=1 Tax=Pyropia yezoensis TaxID=2788 RepID=A0ACC3BIZ7_PYRYE|nr:hypothetical protein I4F81_000095 [Neopyropia yezoensis]
MVRAAAGGGGGAWRAGSLCRPPLRPPRAPLPLPTPAAWCAGCRHSGGHGGGRRRQSCAGARRGARLGKPAVGCGWWGWWWLCRGRWGGGARRQGRFPRVTPTIVSVVAAVPEPTPPPARAAAARQSRRLWQGATPRRRRRRAMSRPQGTWAAVAGAGCGSARGGGAGVARRWGAIRSRPPPPGPPETPLPAHPLSPGRRLLAARWWPWRWPRIAARRLRPATRRRPRRRRSGAAAAQRRWAPEVAAVPRPSSTASPASSPRGAWRAAWRVRQAGGGGASTAGSRGQVPPLQTSPTSGTFHPCHRPRRRGGGGLRPRWRRRVGLWRWGGSGHPRRRSDGRCGQRRSGGGP